MTRLPRNADEAVGELGVSPGASVLVVAPDHGYVEALASAVGDEGRVIVVDPPPDLEDAPAKVEIAAQAPEGPVDVVLAWVQLVGVRGLRDLAGSVGDDGALWAVLPKPTRDQPVSISEGEVKKALLPLGWREEQVVGLTTDAFAVRFRKRRSP